MKRDIKQVIVHCAATPPTMDVTAKDIDRWHRERGYLKIGYHYLIRRDGTVEDGRSLDQPGAHAKGHNKNSIGICLAGGVELDGKTPKFNFTSAQMTALNELVFEIKLGFPDVEIIGHNDVSTKDCPCFDVAMWFSTAN